MLLLALLHSPRTSQTVRRSRQSKEIVSLSCSTTQLPSLPISKPPTVSSTSSTKCSTLQLLPSILWKLLPPNQTCPPSSLPSKLASSLAPSRARVHSLSSHQPTRRSPSCPRRNSPTCWILPTSRSSMLFSNITLLLALLHSPRTSQTVRRSRQSKEIVSLSSSTTQLVPLQDQSGSTTQLPSLPISKPPTVSSTSSTKC